ncbi:hypothetical protein AB5N19_07567 [Seiridium cardinale]|uniref:Conidiation-specific protein 8 n=1 Tax=Seiridium cardinale TaxID=138064 RepID=A0ABR2XT40_9PEZI
MDSSKAPAQGETPQRRRSSQFEGLMSQKRSSDPMVQARRQSIHDQKPTAGFFGQMWHNYTRGPSSPPK